MFRIRKLLRYRYAGVAMAIALAVAMPVSSVWAAPAGGGFSGPGPAVISVEQAKSLRDDDRVTLRGKIVRSLGGEKYLFQDASGTVTLEIENDKWEGRQIGPDQQIEIHGELDKDWNSVEVEVDRIVLLH